MEVKFDSSNGNQFEVTNADGMKRIFQQSEHGIYFYDMRTTWQGDGLHKEYGSTILLNTEAQNKAKYTVSDFKRAEKAW